MVFGMLVSLSCRWAFFATSMFEIRTSKFVVFQYVNKRVCRLPGNCFVVHGDVSRRMICWKKTFINRLLLKRQPARMSVESLLLHRNRIEQWYMEENLNILQTSAHGVIGFYTSHTRTMTHGGKSKYITNLGTRSYRVLHLAYKNNDTWRKI